jgi:hypothetical protein
MKKFQQGDVVMFQVDEAMFTKHCRNGENNKDYQGGTKTKAILAFGEVTGHTHRVNMEKMAEMAGVTLHMGYRGEAGKDVPQGFEVRGETVTLCHEEHNSIDIPPGKYIVRIVREFDHIAGRSRYVAD